MKEKERISWLKNSTTCNEFTHNGWKV